MLNDYQWGILDTLISQNKVLEHIYRELDNKNFNCDLLDKLLRENKDQIRKFTLLEQVKE